MQAIYPIIFLNIEKRTKEPAQKFTGNKLQQRTLSMLFIPYILLHNYAFYKMRNLLSSKY